MKIDERRLKSIAKLLAQAETATLSSDIYSFNDQAKGIVKYLLGVVKRLRWVNECHQHSEDWWRVQWAWQRYMTIWYYNNPNVFLDMHIVDDTDKGWFFTNPLNGERTHLGNTAEEAIQAINSSRAAEGVRATKVESTNYLIVKPAPKAK